jgi:hypothetical protein
MEQTFELDDHLVEALLRGDPAARAARPELSDTLADIRLAYLGFRPRRTTRIEAALGRGEPPTPGGAPRA